MWQSVLEAAFWRIDLPELIKEVKHDRGHGLDCCVERMEGGHLDPFVGGFEETVSSVDRALISFELALRLLEVRETIDTELDDLKRLSLDIFFPHSALLGLCDSKEGSIPFHPLFGLVSEVLGDCLVREERA